MGVWELLFVVLAGVSVFVAHNEWDVREYQESA